MKRTMAEEKLESKEDSLDTVENLEGVLGVQNGKKIVGVEIAHLTAKGENYGSVMLKLDVRIKNNDGTEEEIHSVAKKLPKDEFSRKIFNVSVTVKNEIAMYNTIVPTLQELQRENGVVGVIDYLPKLYGARINLDGKTDEVDDHAVIILENLKESGYVNVDRHVGFDLETTELILKDIAAFHALPIALKLKKPEVFDKKVRPYLTPFMPPEFPEEIENGQKSMIIEMLQENYKCIPFVSKTKTLLQNEKEAKKLPPREPFATVTHGDMWVNNTMVKFEKGKPVKNKLIDFQVCDYGSPARDLFFFLFTSVQLRALRDSFDNLVKFYHDQFISYLIKVGCDIGPFSYNNFLEEMRFATAQEFSHMTNMTFFIIFGKKGGPSREFQPDEKPDFTRMKESIPLEAKEKVQFMVEACGKRGWL